MERYDEQFWRPLGGGRYAVLVRMPWGELVPGQVLVTSREGWGRRPEASDASWSAYPIGPAVVAIRLLGGAASLRADEASTPVRRADSSRHDERVEHAPEEWSGRLAVAGACQ